MTIKITEVTEDNMLPLSSFKLVHGGVYEIQGRLQVYLTSNVRSVVFLDLETFDSHHYNEHNTRGIWTGKRIHEVILK